MSPLLAIAGGVFALVVVLLLVASAWREAASRGAAIVELARTNLELANRLAERTLERDGVARDEALAQLVRTNIQEAYLQTEFDREHRASAAFQKASLPRRLPVLPGLRFRAVYRAAKAEAQVGGDWYDAFRLDDGRVVLSIGDVMGNGLTAAVTMGAVRQSLRGAAYILADPEAMLDAADRALRAEDPDAIVTAFVAVLDPVSLVMRYASAGHPPPLLLLTASREIIALGGNGLPLGLRAEQSYETQPPLALRIDESALLVLFTDGLIEATRDVAASERRVCDAMLEDDVWNAANPAEAIADLVLGDDVVDDVAVLTLRIDSALVSVTHPVATDDDARWRFAGGDAAAAAEACAAMTAVLERYYASSDELVTARGAFADLLTRTLQRGESSSEFALDLAGDRPVLHAVDRAPLPGWDAREDPARGLVAVRSAPGTETAADRGARAVHERVILPFPLRHHARRVLLRA